jgi:hypothetical protein
MGRSAPSLVGRRLPYAIDDEHINRSSRRFQLEAKLFLQRGENRRRTLLLD